jgi:hypothetical protein
VDGNNAGVLYSTLDAAPPKPYGLYARGEDQGFWGEHWIPLNSWTPNVRFLNRTEAQAEPIVAKPGAYEYKTSGSSGTKTYTIDGLKREVYDPKPGLDGAPVVGAFGKNDCNIWATTLQNLIAEEKLYLTNGQDQPRTVNVESKDDSGKLDVQVGERMKHLFQGSSCNYHAATVVAKDGVSLVTLEANVVKDLSRPEFYIHKGLAGFAAEGIQDKLGDKVEVVPLTSLTYEGVLSERETREDRFGKFSEIDPDFWRQNEKRQYNYRGRLVGDIGITWTAEKQRRDELARKLGPQFAQLNVTHDLNFNQSTYTSFPRIED